MPAPRTVLVTGATSGIGRACAQVFSESGSRVIATGRRTDCLQELADELPGECLTLSFDVTDGDAVEQAVGSLTGDWAEVDLLINSAGIAIGRDPLQDMSAADSAKVIQTNVVGALHTIHAILPGMVERGTGHVINIGSNAGREVYPGGAVYCASKAALDRITKGMRMDLLGSGVRVASVDPGMVATEFSARRFGDAARAATLYEGMTPLSARDVAEVVEWVATRPEHVQIADVLVYPTDQAGSGKIARHDR